MAEGWARHFGAGKIEAHSAGTRPAPNVNPFAIAVMKEKEVDISGQKTKALADIEQRMDLIVAVCTQAAGECPVPPAGILLERWDLPDPAAAHGVDEELLRVFRESRDEIGRRVRDLIARI